MVTGHLIQIKDHVSGKELMAANYVVMKTELRHDDTIDYLLVCKSYY